MALNIPAMTRPEYRKLLKQGRPYCYGSGVGRTPPTEGSATQRRKARLSAMTPEERRTTPAISANDRRKAQGVIRSVCGSYDPLEAYDRQWRWRLRDDILPDIPSRSLWPLRLVWLTDPDGYTRAVAVNEAETAKVLSWYFTTEAFTSVEAGPAWAVIQALAVSKYDITRTLE